MAAVVLGRELRTHDEVRISRTLTLTLALALTLTLALTRRARLLPRHAVPHAPRDRRLPQPRLLPWPPRQRRHRARQAAATRLLILTPALALALARTLALALTLTLSRHPNQAAATGLCVAADHLPRRHPLRIPQRREQ